MTDLSLGDLVPQSVRIRRQNTEEKCTSSKNACESPCVRMWVISKLCQWRANHNTRKQERKRKEKKLAHPDAASSLSSYDSPAKVDVHMACVSPRVKIADPCAIGSRLTELLMGRISSGLRPSERRCSWSSISRIAVDMTALNAALSSGSSKATLSMDCGCIHARILVIKKKASDKRPRGGLTHVVVEEYFQSN